MGAKQSIISNPRSSSPPNKFKFSKLQILKLNIIQAALRPPELASEALPELNDPREAFMATISTLITAALNFENATDSNEEFEQSMNGAFKLFTAVFVKNMNLAELVQVFECLFEDRKVSVHLLNSIIHLLSLPQIPTELAQNVLQTLLILLSANLHTSTHQSRYFYQIVLHELDPEAQSLLFESLLHHFCSTISVRPVTNSLWSSLNSSPSLPAKKTKLACLLLLTLFLESTEFFSLLNSFSDSKCHGMLLVIFSRLLAGYPDSLSLSDLTATSMLLNCFLLHSPHFRRFCLSKLDIEEFISSIARVMYLLMRGPGAKQKTLALNLYLLGGILVSLSEDGSFLQQLFESTLDRSKIRWYEGDLGGTGNFGGFLLCLEFDLFGANLAGRDGFRDQYLHEILTALLFNLSQYAKNVDNRCIGDRFFALLNGLLPDCQMQVSSQATHCAIDAICVVVNAAINGPQANSGLMHLLLQDSPRILGFLRRILDTIDTAHSQQLSAHLSEADLEFTAQIVGALRFLEKVQSFLQSQPRQGSFTELLSTLPVPTVRRDGRGEACKLGVRGRIISDSVNPELWASFASNHAWALIYSCIPWQEYIN